MHLRLDLAQRLAEQLGYSARLESPLALRVTLRPEVELVYRNEADRLDNWIGFSGSAWHCHDELTMELEDGSTASYDELQILTALNVGELLVVTLLLDGELWQRWLQHVREPLQLGHLAANRELRVQQATAR
ncbi:MAG TPA: hypothetical protein VI299_16420 [Polyangiales bacterium]